MPSYQFRDIIPRFLIAPSLITCLTLYCGKELKVGLYRNRCCSYGDRIMHRFFRGQGDRDSLYYSSMQIDCNVREHGVNCIHLTKTCNVTISKFGSKFASLSEFDTLITMTCGVNLSHWHVGQESNSERLTNWDPISKITERAIRVQLLVCCVHVHHISIFRHAWWQYDVFAVYTRRSIDAQIKAAQNLNNFIQKEQKICIHHTRPQALCISCTYSNSKEKKQRNLHL